MGGGGGGVRWQKTVLQIHFLVEDCWRLTSQDKMTAGFSFSMELGNAAVQSNWEMSIKPEFSEHHMTSQGTGEVFTGSCFILLHLLTLKTLQTN